MGMNPKIEEEDEDQDWIFSYSDLMSLLLCFFIILYATSKQEEETKQKIEEILAEAFNQEARPKVDVPDTSHVAYMLLALVGVKAENKEKAPETRQADSGSVTSVNRYIEEKVQERFEQALIQEDLTEKSHNSYEFVYPSTIFVPGSNRLTNAARIEFQQITQYLKTVRGIRKIKITAHTDGIGQSPNKITQTASWAGALANALISGGIPSRVIEATGYGGSKPLVREKDKLGNPIQKNVIRNRRIHLIIEVDFRFSQKK